VPLRPVQDHAIFQLQWPVDQDGYEIEERTGTGTTAADMSPPYQVIRPRGGPPRFYRPMTNHSVLWRRFADVCTTADGVLDFNNTSGMLSKQVGLLEDTLARAECLRAVMTSMDAGHLAVAAGIFSQNLRPRLIATIIGTNRGGKFEFQMAPSDLGVH
jgi:hypothetical protein